MSVAARRVSGRFVNIKIRKCKYVELRARINRARRTDVCTRDTSVSIAYFEYSAGLPTRPMNSPTTPRVNEASSGNR